MKVKQIIALVIVVALLMTGSVLVTMAYLTDTQRVVNTFTIGMVSLELDEARVDPITGAFMDKDNNEVDTIEQAARVTANAYKLMPGRIYSKDPTVTVKAGSESSYVRIVVTFEKWDKLCAAYENLLGEGETMSLEALFPEGKTIGDGWTLASSDAVNGKFVYTYTGTGANGEVPAVEADLKLPALFTQIQLDPGVKVLTDLNEMKIVVVAHAIQAEGFADADEAWEAFDDEQPTTAPDASGQPA